MNFMAIEIHDDKLRDLWLKCQVHSSNDLEVLFYDFVFNLMINFSYLWKERSGKAFGLLFNIFSKVR